MRHTNVRAFSLFKMVLMTAPALCIAACSAGEGEQEQSAETQSVQSTLSATPVSSWNFESCPSTNGVTCAQGPLREAGNFNGSAYISSGTGTNFSSAMSAAAWVRTTASDTSAVRPILSKWSTTSTSQSYRLYISGGKFNFSVRIAGVTKTVSANVPTQAGRFDLWNHVVGVYNGSEVAIYLNGSKVTGTSATGSIQSSTSTVYVGRDPSTSNRFVGRMDNVQLFGSALSQADISELAGIESGISPKKTRKVLFAVYNPTLSSGQRLAASRGWFDPQAQMADILATLRIASGGYVDYQFGEVHDRNEFPQHQSGFGYNETTYASCMDDPAHASCTSSEFDFAKMFSDMSICSKLTGGSIDEVMIMGAPYFHTDEFAWKIKGDALPYNTPTNAWLYELRKKNIPDCGKSVFIMGFNYERDLSNAIHSYGHRAESALAVSVGRGFWDGCAGTSDFDKFTCIAKNVNATNPTAGAGAVHYPPNGQTDYDYGNLTSVNNIAASFENYPYSTPTVKNENCNAYGCSENGFLQWWLGKFPNKDGVTSNANLKNWWKYVVDFDAAITEAKGGTGSTCNPTISAYTAGKCNATVVYQNKLYKCISQAAGVNGEPSGCGTPGVYCSNIPPTDPAWGSTAWQFVQNCQ